MRSTSSPTTSHSVVTRAASITVLTVSAACSLASSRRSDYCETIAAPTTSASTALS
jgi:hypothetical protein